MLDLEDLRTFVEAATQGTFTAAASGLYTTQPSLSRRIARLERQLGGTLFDRTNRRSPSLAPLGRALLPYARELLAEHQRFVSIAEDRLHSGGTLTIALSAVSGAAAIPLLCEVMAAGLPDVRVKFLERSEGIGVREALLSREAEVGLLAPAFLSAELTGVTFGLVEHLALGLPALIGEGDDAIEWELLRELPLLLPMAATEMRYPHHDNLRIAHEDGAPEVLVAMARAGLGVALLNGIRHPRGLTVRPVAIGGVVQRTRLLLSWRHSTQLSANAEKLVEDVRRALADRAPQVLVEAGASSP